MTITRMKAIQCNALIDGFADEPIEDGVLLTEDGEVTELGPADSVSIPDEAEVIDYTDGVVVPGLIDAHVHLLGVRNLGNFERISLDTPLATLRAAVDLRKQLASGFTTVRDCGSRTGLALRSAIEEGTILGPRVYTSGVRFSQTSGHGDQFYLPLQWAESDDAPGYADLVDGADECRKAVRRRLREGVDLIKILGTGGIFTERDSPHHVQFSAEEISVFTEEAHKYDVPVACHGQGTAGIKLALEHDVDTIEHAIYLDEEVIQLMTEQDTTIVSTLVLNERFTTKGEDHGIPQYVIDSLQEMRDDHFRSLRQAHNAGVPIALGTDSVGHDLNPHGESIREAELFVEEIGMSEIEAVRAATVHAGRTVRDEKLGGLAPGKYADFLVLNSNPLDDITALRDIEYVYKDGIAVSDGTEAPVSRGSLP